MKLRKVKPSEIEIPELRVRARFDQETLQILQSSIKEVGIVAPVIVCQVDEKLVLVDGEHRLTEAKNDGMATIDVVVFEGDMTDVLTKNLFLDHVRGKTPVGDMVKVIGALYTDYGLDPDKIKEKTGLTRDYTEKLIKISQASPVVMQALDEGWIGVGIAYELSRLPHPAQQEEIIAKQRVYHFKVEDIKELVDDTLVMMQTVKIAPPGAAATSQRALPVYLCEGCKESVEPRYLRPVMLCPDCFGNVWRLAKATKTIGEEKNPEEATP